MELCNECDKLQGRPANQSRSDDLTLVGIGECEGVLAIEHYRCGRCGVVMHRQFTGKTLERVWTPLYWTA